MQVILAPYCCFRLKHSQLRTLGTRTPSLVSMYAWVGYDGFKLGVQIFLVSSVPIKTFNMSLESTQNMQQYGIKTTCRKVSESYGDRKCD